MWTVELERVVCRDGIHVALADNYQVARAVVDGLNLLEERLQLTQDDEVGRIAWLARLNEWARYVNAPIPEPKP